MVSGECDGQELPNEYVADHDKENTAAGELR